MSVALLIEKINQEEIDSYMPVSTEEVFKQYWLPISEKLNLEWIPLFESGASFTENDLPEILKELNIFKIKLKEYLSEGNQEYDYIMDRVENLISSLNELMGNKVEFYIG